MPRLVKRCFLILFLVLFVGNFIFPFYAEAASSCTQTNWFNSGWIYRKRIVFNNSAQNENLTNFPVLVHLTSSNFEFGKTRASGQDIRFTDSDGTTTLNYEIEKWDANNGDADVWVNVPQIDSSSSTDYIYMYYGNSGASDGQTRTSVWSNSFVEVHHLKEQGNGTAGEYLDSTSNANSGQGGGGTLSAVPTLTANGKIDSAQTFDGSSSFIGLPTNATNNITGAATFQAWINTNNLTLPGNHRMILTYGDPSNATYMSLTTNGVDQPFISLRIGGTQRSLNSAFSVSINTWYLITATWDTDKIRIYVNGDLKNTSSSFTGALETSGTGKFIGKYSVAGFEFSGLLDEVRVSSTARSANWIAAQYKSETDSFNNYSQEEGYRAECSPASPQTSSSCTETAPSSPVINSIIPGSNSATIYFSKASGSVSYYALEYGTGSGNYQYGSTNIGGADASNYTVNYLSPGVTYYFRIRAGNACAVGPWSEEKSQGIASAFYQTITLPTTTPVPATATPAPIPTETPSPTSEPVKTEPLSINLLPIFNFISQIWRNYSNGVININSKSIALVERCFSTVINSTRSGTERLAHFIASTVSFGVESVNTSLKAPREFGKNFSNWISYSVTSFGEIVLDNTPTQIFDVKASRLTPTKVVISWRTNHLSTSKVNFGETLDYGEDAQSKEKVHEHIVELSGLKPNTKYFYEVMSQNNDYVYDAHHEFTTPTSF